MAFLRVAASSNPALKRTRVVHLASWQVFSAAPLSLAVGLSTGNSKVDEIWQANKRQIRAHGLGLKQRT